MVLNIMDTSACEEYRSFREQYIRIGQGVLLVCSLLNRDSFNELKEIIDLIFSIKVHT